MGSMDTGWIKTHRKFKESSFYKKSQYVHLWLHLLLSANHKPNKIMWNNKEITIKSGEFLTGRKTLSEDTGIPESTIEDILNFFESQRQIRQQKTTKFRIITILKWSNYQISDNKSDNKATTKQQQPDTNKNDKNDKNDKNIYPQNFLSFWKIYPRKKKKASAFEIFEELRPSDTLLKIIKKDIEDKIASGEWENQTYVPYPENYLKDRRWEDEDNDTPLKSPRKFDWKKEIKENIFGHTKDKKIVKACEILLENNQPLYSWKEINEEISKIKATL